MCDHPKAAYSPAAKGQGERWAVAALPLLAEQSAHKLPAPGTSTALLLPSKSPKKSFFVALFASDSLLSAALPVLSFHG